MPNLANALASSSGLVDLGLLARVTMTRVNAGDSSLTIPAMSLSLEMPMISVDLAGLKYSSIASFNL